MNVYQLENIIEEHAKMKKELARRQEIEHQKAVAARTMLDDESLVYDLVKCVQKLRANSIITEKESEAFIEELRIKFAKRGIHFVKPFGRREPRYE